ncbi:MAG: response regulator [Chloroflexota bacterium]
MSNPNENDGTIKILLVDDIAETRQSIKKLLAFEQDFKVIGEAGNGRTGVEQAKDLRPDIIIMDINMPDMDGLEAAGLITKAVPTAGVIMMSVQDDPDYMQKAMLAGARFFLAKPVTMDALYSTIRNVYDQYEGVRRQFKALDRAQYDIMQMQQEEKKPEGGDRAGHIIAVYSPQGGVGTTMLATSLASGLMKENVKTLLVDCDLQFGDVSFSLNLKSPTTLVDVVDHEGDLDIEYFDSIISTHSSGMKVLLGPSRPSFGMDIRDSAPEAVASAIDQIRYHYDFVVLDLGKSIDAVTANLFDVATKIVLVVVPTITCIKNVKLVLDLFDQNEFDPSKTVLTINKAVSNPRSKVVIAPERIQSVLKRPVEGLIPLVDETLILNAIQSGIPVIASDRDTSKTPIKELLAFSNHLFKQLVGSDEFFEDDFDEKPDTQSKRSWTGLFGNR